MQVNLEECTKARRYAGVPFALSPTGEFRCRKPRKISEGFIYCTSNDSPYDYTRFDPVCPQADYSRSGRKLGLNYYYDEDCLRLNL